MYREKSSEPLIDTETGVTFVALPFLHFKDTHKFDITMDKKVVRLSCGLIFDSDFRSNAHLFGDFANVSESAPIYCVHYIDVLSQSEGKIKMSGPERKAAFDDVLPLFGKMLLRFEDCSASLRLLLMKTISSLTSNYRRKLLGIMWNGRIHISYKAEC